jgi:cadmium resistance protein CadD (predicted permease)
MISILTMVGAAIVVFVSTNIDDIVLLSVLFADPKLRPRAIVAGQFIGIGLLVLGSALVAAAATAIPPGWTSLLGAVPLLLGLHKAVSLLRSRGSEAAAQPDEVDLRKVEGRSQILAVSAITLANGGDNVGVYVPLFAANPAVILVYAAVFAAMTALWCALGYKLVNNAVFGAKLRRYGHVILPVVLIALGIHILSGARVLLR